MPYRLTIVARSIQKKFAGQVSRTMLLTALLPLSLVSFFSTVIVAACFFPAGYDWRVHVISDLTSPRKNPQGYWLPSLGIMVAMLLALPFARYVAQRLRAIMPPLARSTGHVFAFNFVLMIIALAAQLAQPVIGLRWLHSFLASASVGLFIIGMVYCCVCALKDRSRGFGGQGLLPGALAIFWLSLTLLPIICLAGIGSLKLLGHHAGITWVEDFRQLFRHTMLYQLAFWEWIGAVLAFAFLIGSVLLLPVSCGESRTRSGRASAPAEAGVDALLREHRRTS